MIKVTNLSQRNWLWRWTSVGFGRPNFGQVGCLVTSLSSLLNYNDPRILNNQLKAVNGFAGPQRNLVIWGALPKATNQKIFKATRYYRYDNTAVKALISKGNAVPVEVDAGPIGAPGTSHWVLFIGDKLCMDPWVGYAVPTSKYPKLLGYTEILTK